MDQLWTLAKSLKGTTLRTPDPKRGAPFKVVDASETGLKIRARTGYETSYSREVIEAGCRHRLNGGEVRVTTIVESSHPEPRAAA